MSRAVAEEEKEERYFVWVDFQGKRCGPRHLTMKAAINYKLSWTPIPQPDSEGRYNLNGRLVGHEPDWVRNRMSYPSQEEPAALRVAELHLRDLEPEEQTKLEQIIALKQEGLI